VNAEDLRSVQAPLKERYRDAPEAALITLRAQGRIGEDVSCKIETGKALVVAGLHPATGGSGQAACSGDMLLEALVACAGVTLNAVATALGINLRRFRPKEIWTSAEPWVCQRKFQSVSKVSGCSSCLTPTHRRNNSPLFCA